MWWLLPIIIIVVLLRTPTAKGMIGEFIVKLVLGNSSEKQGEEKIVINSHFPFIGDYFKELNYGGYSRSIFEYNGDLYLRITTSKFDSITPIENGFNEIKGSQYYDAYEKFKEGGTN